MARKPRYKIKARTMKIGGKYTEGWAFMGNKKGDWWLNKTFNQMKIRRK